MAGRIRETVVGFAFSTFHNTKVALSFQILHSKIFFLLDRNFLSNQSHIPYFFFFFCVSKLEFESDDTNDMNEDACIPFLPVPFVICICQLVRKPSHKPVKTLTIYFIQSFEHQINPFTQLFFFYIEPKN